MALSTFTSKSAAQTTDDLIKFLPAGTYTSLVMLVNLVEIVPDKDGIVNMAKCQNNFGERYLLWIIWIGMLFCCIALTAHDYWKESRIFFWTRVIVASFVFCALSLATTDLASCLFQTPIYHNITRVVPTFFTVVLGLLGGIFLNHYSSSSTNVRQVIILAIAKSIWLVYPKLKNEIILAVTSAISNQYDTIGDADQLKLDIESAIESGIRAAFTISDDGRLAAPLPPPTHDAKTTANGAGAAGPQSPLQSTIHVGGIEEIIKAGQEATRNSHNLLSADTIGLFTAAVSHAISFEQKNQEKLFASAK